MIRFKFKGWTKFGAHIQRPVIKHWLKTVQDKSKRLFTDGLKRGPHTGRIYALRGGRRHQASARREFPASRSGGLLKSLKTAGTSMSATVGTNVYYAKFLREGTRHMRRRKMSDTALKLGAYEAMPQSKGWVKFAKSRNG